LEGLPAGPNALLEAVEALLERTIQEADGERTGPLVNMLVLIGTSLARRLQNVVAEYRILRTGAIAFSVIGLPQASRDLAEHGLKMAAEQAMPDHLRAAWHLFTEVYLRARNVYEAALGLACAGALEISSNDPDEAFRDSYLVARLARDTGLLSLAREAVQRAEACLSDAQRAGINGLEVEALRASIETRAILSLEQSDSGEPLTQRIEVFSGHLAQLLDRALTLKAPVLPVLLLLAQVRAAGDRLGARFPAEVQDVYVRALETLEPAQRPRVSALLEESAESSVAAISRVARLLGSTRFAQDLGTDMAEGRAVAHRLIGREPLPPAVEVAFALDWLGDYSVRLPSNDSNMSRNAELQEGGVEILQWAARQTPPLSSQQLGELLAQFSDVGVIGPVHFSSGGTCQ
jgi:hypothetical protein